MQAQYLEAPEVELHAKSANPAEFDKKSKGNVL
jgi:hypothetical protein